MRRRIGLLCIALLAACHSDGLATGDGASPGGDVPPVDLATAADLGAGIDLGGGGVDLAHLSDGGAPADLKPSPGDGFPCGDGMCVPVKQYCLQSNYGDAGLGPGFCMDIFGDCAMKPTCACVQFRHQCLTSCQQYGGIMYVQCPKL